jgi:hypothetical protein
MTKEVMRMEADIIKVSTAVVMLTQIIKWSGAPDKYGPFLVMALSALGVALYTYSEGHAGGTRPFDYFESWVLVTTSAAGVFGFTRAGHAAVTAIKSPPPGAGASPTEKIG